MMKVNMWQKPLSEMNIRDMAKVIKKVAIADKDMAMDLYGKKPVEAIRESMPDVFLPSGKLSNDAKDDLIDSLIDCYKLTKKEAKDEFKKMTIKDFYNFAVSMMQKKAK